MGAPGVLADDTLPSDLRVVANDEYTKSVHVGENASFIWSVVNVGLADYNVTVTGNVSSLDYALAVVPANAPLRSGEVLTVLANVTVPGSPRASQAVVDIVVRLDGGRHAHFRASVLASAPLRFVDLGTAFLAVAAIIFIGFLASLVFERTKVPDLIFLIILGLILGPVLATVFNVTLVPLDLLKLATPYLATLALMIILFDGGLNLNIRQVLSRAGVSVVQTGITWFGSVFIITIVAMLFLGYPPLVGVLLGAILGGTSSAIVIGLVRGMSMSEDSRTILVLESTITDVLCIIGALTLIGVLSGRGTLGETVGDIATAFLVALVLGAVAGLLWLRVLSQMQRKPFGFMITIAALFLLYAGTEFLGGSGGMAALVFGLILGNHRQIAESLGKGRRLAGITKVWNPLLIDDSFKQFHSEITFAVRTFFFVFLGFSFALPFGVEWAVRSPLPGFSLLNDTFWLVAFAIVLMFLGIWALRAIAARVTVGLHRESKDDRQAITIVMGRGLAAAVLASLPFAIPAFTDPANPDYGLYHNTMAPYETQFLTIAFLVILLTVITTSAGVVSIERRRKRERVADVETVAHGNEAGRTEGEGRAERGGPDRVRHQSGGEEPGRIEGEATQRRGS
jgi:cell volume regulation protein A